MSLPLESMIQQQTQPMASASLYVGDLSPEVPESKLYEIFNNIGQVQSVRVLRDVNTRRSLGYAYVNFHRVDDAERALEIMNFKVIGDRPCRIMWSQRNPDLRRSGKGNIFVKHLPDSMDHEALRDTFIRFGTILSCKVAMNARGEKLGYGFVHFQDEAHAAAAVLEVDGKCLDNNPKPVYVAHFKSKSQRGGVDNFTNVYFKNMPRSMTDENVLEMFRKCGTITSSKLVVATDESKTNFGFVNFQSSAEAKAAIDAMHDMEIAGKKLVVVRAQRKDERLRELKERFEQLKATRQYSGFNLYVKNLPDNVTEESLMALFTKFGEISSAKVMIDEKTGKPKGFGFVCFVEQQAANNAIGLNGQMIEGKPLYVALAQRLADRRAAIEQRMANRSRGATNSQYMPGPYAMRGPPHIGMPGYMAPYPNHMSNMPMRGPQSYQLVPQGHVQGAGRGSGPRRGGRGQRQGGNMQMRGGQPNNGGQPNQMRYTDNARNRQPQAPQQVPAPVNQQVNMEDLSTQDFARHVAALPEKKRKLVFGERLFPLVHNTQPDLAPKITGMLLEMDDPEIIELLDSPDALQSKISEALSVLEESAATE